MSVAYFLAKRIHFTKGDDSQRVSPPAIRIAISGIAIGVAVMLITVAIVVGFKREVEQKVIDFGGHVQVQAFVANSTYELPPICMSDTMVSHVAQRVALQRVERMVTKPAVIKTDSDFLSIVMKGVETLPDATWSERDVCLSRTIADKLQLGVGDMATFYFVQTDMDADPFALGAEGTQVKARRLTVRDIYETHFSEIDQQMVIGSASLLQDVSGWDDDMYSAVSITLADTRDMDEACITINRMHLIDRRATPLYAQTIEELHPTVFAWLALLDTNVWVILILIAAVAAFTMISGLLIIILERTQMIGILKAQGMDNATLRRVFLWVAFFLTGKGIVWGNLIGLALCYIQYRWHVVALDPANYYLEWVPIHLTLPMIVAISLGTVAITLMVLVGPSALVARISPTKAIQSE